MDTLVALAADLHEVGAIGQTCQGELEAMGVARCLHLMEQHATGIVKADGGASGDVATDGDGLAVVRHLHGLHVAHGLVDALDDGIGGGETERVAIGARGGNHILRDDAGTTAA